ncbi:Peroxidase 42 [Glycine soja]|uniref:peroxidase n=1 Tax=Glycine soja TaxID=3848 RepID=A0A445KYD3_GLYSO|nr:Peroxidase 42 [Glycine soja]
MSALMETELTTDQNGAAYQHPLPIPEDKVLVPVEVTLKPSSTTKIDNVRSAVKGKLEKRSLSYNDGPVLVPLDDAFLADNVQRICVCGCDTGSKTVDAALQYEEAEDIITEQVKLLYKRHKNTTFSWLRNIFHDCVVQSCDASLLLDSTRRSLSEKETNKNFELRNFRYIETIKEALERECPRVVSCADILVLSTRDGIVLIIYSSQLVPFFFVLFCFLLDLFCFLF